MTDTNLQELMARCESGEASQADLERMRSILHRQELDSELWGGGRALLAGAVRDEAGEVTGEERIIEEVGEEIGREIGAVDSWRPVADALRQELARNGETVERMALDDTVLERVAAEEQARRRHFLEAFRQELRLEGGSPELASAILQQVAPREARQWERVMHPVREGIRARAAGIDLCPGILSRVFPEAEARAHRFREALAEGLLREAESVDLLEPVMDRVTVGEPQAEAQAAEAPPLDSAFSVLASGLEADSSGFDVADRVMARIGTPRAEEAPAAAAPQEQPEVLPELDRALDVLRAGIQDRADRVDMSSAIMSQLAREQELAASESSAVAEAMEALAAGLAAEAVGVDVVPSVMQAVAPKRDVSLDSAFETLAAGIEAEAVGFSVADGVMDRVLGADSLGMQLCALVDGELHAAGRRLLAVRLRDDARSRLAMTSWRDLGRTVRRALSQELSEQPIPSVWPAVAQAIDARAETPEVQREAAMDALRTGLASESEKVDLGDEIMAAILPPPVREPEPLELPETEPAPEPSRSPSWLGGRVPLLTLLLGAATVLFMMNTMQHATNQEVAQQGAQAEEATFELAEVNNTEIEDLTVSDEAMVQVFQLEEGAPMVIFIDESAGSEGVTL